MRTALIALILSSALVAPAFGEKCVASLNYEKDGGDLEKFTPPEDIPDSAKRCPTPNCNLQADIRLVVQQDGSVRDVEVIMIDDRGAPADDSAEAMRQWFSGLHFEPPMLHGKPVCLNLEWNFGFAQRRSNGPLIKLQKP